MKLFLACLMMLTGSAWAEWVLFLDQEKAQFFMIQPRSEKMEICVGFGHYKT